LLLSKLLDGLHEIDYLLKFLRLDCLVLTYITWKLELINAPNYPSSSILTKHSYDLSTDLYHYPCSVDGRQLDSVLLT